LEKHKEEEGGGGGMKSQNNPIYMGECLNYLAIICKLPPVPFTKWPQASSLCGISLPLLNYQLPPPPFFPVPFTRTKNYIIKWSQLVVCLCLDKGKGEGEKTFLAFLTRNDEWEGNEAEKMGERAAEGRRKCLNWAN
jgi:hypothetical protein